MKRSKRIATLTLGGACLVVLAGCGESTEDMKVYQTVDECVAETSDRALCESELTAAKLAHEDTAPRFDSDAACKQEFENCVGVPGVGGTTSWFMPALGGFVLGRMIGQPFAQPVFYDRKGYAFVRNLPPDRRSEEGTYFGTSSSRTFHGTGAGSTIRPVAGSSGGYSKVARSSTGGSSSAITVSRGGFGSSGKSSSS